jgi:membrane protease YdiL (CAAX protease family)
MEGTPHAPKSWPALGHGLARSPATLATAAVAAVATVALDVVLARGGYERRWIAPFLALCAFVALVRGDVRSLGWRLRPAPSLRWWALAIPVLAAVVGVALVGFYFVCRVTVADLVFPRLFDERTVGAWAVLSLVEAPLVEEMVYRLVLLTALVPWLGRWPSILISGVVFAALHWVYRNPGPDNHVAGFVLSWVFVRSGCPWLPVVLHAAGNALVLLFHLGLQQGWLQVPHVRLG